MQYECPECGYSEQRTLLITRYTMDATCPDCNRVRLKPQSEVEKAERLRTNNFKRYFSRKGRKHV
jgi:hypothetical protein